MHEYAKNRIQEALSIIGTTVFFANRIDEQILKRLKEEFPLMVDLFEKLLEDEFKNRIQEAKVVNLINELKKDQKEVN